MARASLLTRRAAAPETDVVEEPPRPARRHGALLLSLSSVAVGLVNYAYALLLARYLAQSAYASFAACQTIILLSTTVATAAIPWLLARDLSGPDQSLDTRRRAVGFALSANLIIGLAAALVSGLAVARFASLAVVGLVVFSVIGNFVISTWMGWAQGTARFATLAAIMVSQVSMKVVVGFVAVKAHQGVAGALLGNALAVAVLVVAGSYALRHEIARAGRALWSKARWYQAFSLGALQVVSTFLGSVDVLSSVEVLRISADTGSYQYANALGRIPTFLAAAIATAAFPRVLRHRDPRAEIRASLDRLCLIAVPLTAATASVPHHLLSLVVAAKYTQVAHYLPFTAINGLGSALLIAQLNFFKASHEHKRTLTVAGVVCAFATVVVAGSALIWGVYGIAVSASVIVWVAAAGLSLLSRSPYGECRPHWPPVHLVVVLSLIIVATRVQPALWLATCLLLVPASAWIGFGLPVPRLLQRLSPS